MLSLEKIGTNLELYEFKVIDEAEVVLKSSSSDEANYGAVRHNVDLEEVRGRRVRLSAGLRTQNATAGAGLWLRASTVNQLISDGMYDRLFMGTHPWQKCTLVIDVPVEAEHVTYGLWMIGNGTCAMRDAVLEVVDDQAISTTTDKVFQQTGPNSWKEL